MITANATAVKSTPVDVAVIGGGPAGSAGVRYCTQKATVSSILAVPTLR